MNKKIAILSLVLLFCGNAFAENIFKIEIGKDYMRYSDSDLRRRVWELERAVFQLQQRVFQLETEKPSMNQPPPVIITPSPETWVCKISAMGDNYVGTGASKALATAKAVENCTKGRNGDSFFCKDAKCEQ